MERDEAHESRGSEQAVSEIPLSDPIAVDQLHDLLSLIRRFSALHLWLERAQDASSGAPFATIYQAAPEELLWVMQLEIGTPNVLKIKGPVAQLTATATLVAALLGLPKIPFEIGKIWLEAASIQADIDKKTVDQKSAELDLVEKADRLAREGQISAEAAASIRREAVHLHICGIHGVGIVRDEPRLTGAHEASVFQLTVQVCTRARALGIHDADLDLLLAVDAGDPLLVKRALDAGADPSLPLSSLLNRVRPLVGEDDVFNGLLARLLIEQHGKP